jgi:environmental stress-induced protein Ves
MLARHLTASDYIRQPWRNGRGTTVELAREDNAKGVQLWRLSIADVVEAGPFSPFPDIDRVIMLLDGPGFDIDFGKHGKANMTAPLVPVSFSGGWPTKAENVTGPSKDLNLMTARGWVTAAVTVHAEAAGAPIADRTLIYAADAVEVSYGGSVTKLAAGDVLGLSEGRDAVATGQGGRFVRVDLTWTRSRNLLGM